MASRQVETLPFEGLRPSYFVQITAETVLELFSDSFKAKFAESPFHEVG